MESEIDSTINCSLQHGDYHTILDDIEFCRSQNISSTYSPYSPFSTTRVPFKVSSAVYTDLESAETNPFSQFYVYFIIVFFSSIICSFIATLFFCFYHNDSSSNSISKITETEKYSDKTFHYQNNYCESTLPVGTNDDEPLKSDKLESCKKIKNNSKRSKRRKKRRTNRVTSASEDTSLSKISTSTAEEVSIIHNSSSSTKLDHLLPPKMNSLKIIENSSSMQDIEKNMYTKILLAGVQSELSLGRKASQISDSETLVSSIVACSPSPSIVAYVPQPSIEDLIPEAKMSFTKKQKPLSLYE